MSLATANKPDRSQSVDLLLPHRCYLYHESYHMSRNGKIEQEEGLFGWRRNAFPGFFKKTGLQNRNNVSYNESIPSPGNTLRPEKRGAVYEWFYLFDESGRACGE